MSISQRSRSEEGRNNLLLRRLLRFERSGEPGLVPHITRG